MRARMLALAYFGCVAAIVVVADNPGTQHVFAPLWRLPLGDKIGHFFLMGGFSLAVNIALGARIILLRRAPLLLGSLLVFALVAAEECSQIWVGGRTFDLLDLLMDALGIFAMGEVARRIVRRAA